MVETLFVLPSISGKGGTETVTSEVAKYYQSKKKEFIIVVMNGSDDNSWLESFPNIETPHHDNKIIRNLSYIYQLNKIIRKYQPKTIICLDPILCTYLKWLIKFNFRKTVLISWIHWSLFSPGLRYRQILSAKYHLSISTGQFEQFMEMGVPRKNVQMISNPVKESSFIVPQTKPEEKKRFIYVGRILFEDEKRLKDIFYSLSNVIGDWQLDLYGAGPNVDICQEYCQQLGILERVVFHGFVKDPFQAIDYPVTALLLSSEHEGFGMVLVEAISAGIYSISSNCPVGPKDIIIPNVNGELYELGNLEEFTSILQKLVSSHRLPEPNQIVHSIDYMRGEKYFNNFETSVKYFEMLESNE